VKISFISKAACYFVYCYFEVIVNLRIYPPPPSDFRILNEFSILLGMQFEVNFVALILYVFIPPTLLNFKLSKMEHRFLETLHAI